MTPDITTYTKLYEEYQKNKINLEIAKEALIKISDWRIDESPMKISNKALKEIL